MTNSKKIAIAADHGGFDMKQFIISRLYQQDYDVMDLGTDSLTSVDYPDYADKMALAIKNGEVERGILICGTGIGMSISANRYSFINAAQVADSYSARLSREHNNANVLVLGARVIGPELAWDCVKVFLNTEFLGGRHADRIKKIGSKC